MLKIGQAFRATHRIGYASTWRLLAIDDKQNYLLEAIGETLARCESDYRTLMKFKPETTTWEDCCRMSVNETWFHPMKIEILEED